MRAPLMDGKPSKGKSFIGKQTNSYAARSPTRGKFYLCRRTHTLPGDPTRRKFLRNSYLSFIFSMQGELIRLPGDPTRRKCVVGDSYSWSLGQGEITTFSGPLAGTGLAWWTAPLRVPNA